MSQKCYLKHGDMVFWIVLSSLKFALVGKMWGKFWGVWTGFWKRKSAVSYCLTAP